MRYILLLIVVLSRNLRLGGGFCDGGLQLDPSPLTLFPCFIDSAFGIEVGEDLFVIIAFLRHFLCAPLAEPRAVPPAAAGKYYIVSSVFHFKVVHTFYHTGADG